MRRKSRRGGQGFTLIETIVGFSMILTVVLGFTAMMAAEGKRLSWETDMRSAFEEAREMALSGEGEETGKELRILFTRENGENSAEERFEIHRAAARWEYGEAAVEFYRHE
ncbi:MAG TPA: hypothetical protein H9704_08025 [Candidatus Enterocloster excrementipullorum]|uniref:Prepilin-type cleavage/methylation domain-containing protein n=1 Tax=Candidatus Enterocloster excrementipullorum TaxID=2838559 RepID=A0A9D2N122_9FIRM|nr:hypothetical protein [Candidatus Enterocloster excrementipullorum]